MQADLPADLRAMDKDAQAAVIANKQKERQAINARIDELSQAAQARSWTRARKPPRADGAADGFDVAAKKALQASRWKTTPCRA